MFSKIFKTPKATKKTSEDDKQVGLLRDTSMQLPQSTAITIPTVLDNMRKANEIMREKYLEKLLCLYHELKNKAVREGRLYFSIELDKTYINKNIKKDIEQVALAASTDGLKAVHYLSYSDIDYVIFCDPKLYGKFAGFDESVIDLSCVRVNSAKVIAAKLVD
jgi:hypothetical protein